MDVGSFLSNRGLGGLDARYDFSLLKGYLLQGSLNYIFGGHQTMQMYGKFEGFPMNSALSGLVSYNDPCVTSLLIKCQ